METYPLGRHARARWRNVRSSYVRMRLRGRLHLAQRVLRQRSSLVKWRRSFLSYPPRPRLLMRRVSGTNLRLFRQHRQVAHLQPNPALSEQSGRTMCSVRTCGLQCPPFSFTLPGNATIGDRGRRVPSFGPSPRATIFTCFAGDGLTYALPYCSA